MTPSISNENQSLEDISPDLVDDNRGDIFCSARPRAAGCSLPVVEIVCKDFALLLTSFSLSGMWNGDMHAPHSRIRPRLARHKSARRT
jgi:hypothetical protein